MSVTLTRVQQTLGYTFRQQTLLETALTHRSVGKDNNERLEYLGDAVVNFIVAHLLYEQFPSASEGQLSRLRAHLVKGPALAEVARALQLGDHLRLGQGELKSGGVRRESILAGAMEAVIGAVYLDGGFEAACTLVKALYRDILASLSLEEGFKDPKTRLQEWLQGRRMILPEYRVLATTGDAHHQSFHIECVITEMAITTEGRGNSRRQAEQEAAGRALLQLEQTGKRS